MRRFPSTASRLIPTTVLLLGCTAGRGGSSQGPSTELSVLWSAPECFVADTTAPTADTMYVIGAAQQHDEMLREPFDCVEERRPMTENGTAPVVVSMAVPAGADLRDILDLGLVTASGHRPDVVVTREPDVIAYAARRDGYITSALPWSSTYLLVGARVPAATIQSSDSTVPSRDSTFPTREFTIPSPDERDALARDAVTADSRGAAEPFSWLTDTSCTGVGAGGSAAPLPVIAYAAGDVTARQLAERVLSLAGANPRRAWLSAVIGERDRLSRTTLRIAAVPADSIRDALATGRAVAAVMSIARDPLARCGMKGEAWVPAGAVPLIDTRAHVIVRRGSGAAFFVAPDGSLRFIRQRPR